MTHELVEQEHELPQLQEPQALTGYATLRSVTVLRDLDRFVDRLTTTVMGDMVVLVWIWVGLVCL